MKRGPMSCDFCGREMDARYGWVCPRCSYNNIRGREFGLAGKRALAERGRQRKKDQ